MFFGLGSDGTVGANKSSVKIIGEQTDLFAQGYFVYDSKKSGSVTISHLRFGPQPIRSTYLIDDADFVACHQFGLLEKMKVVEYAKAGATMLLNSPWPAATVWDHLPAEVQRELIAKDIALYVIDADEVARATGMANRVNTVMQPCFFALSGVLPADEAIGHIKASVEATYGKRGRSIVERNFAAIDASLAALERVEIPSAVTSTTTRLNPIPADAPEFVRRVTAALLAGEGDLLPVSALPIDGVFPTGTAKYEKRSIASEIPIFDPDVCIDCGRCAAVCPHAAIRMKVYEPAPSAGAPDGFRSKAFRSKDVQGQWMSIQVAPDDCTGCGVCVDVCPAKSKSEVRHKAINMSPAARTPRRRTCVVGLLPHHPRDRPRRAPPRLGEGFPGAAAAVRVLGCLRRLRRNAVHQARHPVVRRPDDRGQRHRMLVDLRCQPADHPVCHERRGAGTGVEQLVVRGQRRVRARHAPRLRSPALAGAPPPRTPRPPPRRLAGERAPHRRPVDRRRDPRAASNEWRRWSRRSPLSPTTSTPPICGRSPTPWWTRVCGSSVATDGRTTSASAVSTRSCRAAAT